jgi:hypothetical protein
VIRGARLSGPRPARREDWGTQQRKAERRTRNLQWLAEQAARRRLSQQRAEVERQAIHERLERDHGLHPVELPELSEEIAITWPTL